MRRMVLWAALVALAGTALVVWNRPAGLRPPPAPGHAVPSARLPVLGLVGDLPPAETSLVLEVTVPGPPVSGGRELTPESFLDLLQSRADLSREEDGPICSRLDVVLRVDREAAWWRTAQILEACADPKVRAPRVWFAALPEAGGEEGAMAAFLPEPG